MGFNTSVVLLNDAIHMLDDDKDFGPRLRSAVLALSRGKPQDVSIGNHVNACHVVETHHADGVVPILVGGNCGVPVNGVWIPSGFDHSGMEQQLLKELARKYGFTLRKEEHMKNKGVHVHRLQKSRGNPDEVKFAEAWETENEYGSVLAYLLQSGSQGGRPPSPSDRDRTVAATVMQWLGSPVGQSFLKKVGFVRQCTSKSGPIQCEHIKGHKHAAHGADVGTGYAQWGKGL